MKTLLAFFILIQLPLCGALAPLNWSMPTTIFSSMDEESITPGLTIHPSLPKANVAWISQGSSFKVYGAESVDGMWSNADTITTSSYPLNSLKVSATPNGTNITIWNLEQEEENTLQLSKDSGEGWSPVSSIENLGEIPIETAVAMALPDDGIFLLSWEALNDRFEGISYLLGTFINPLFFNVTELFLLQSTLSRGNAIFATSSGLYEAVINPDAPSDNLIKRTSFPRSIVPSSLNLAISPYFEKVAFVFQDQKTQFLIAALDSGVLPSYTTISTSAETVEFARIALSPIDKLPAAIWQLASGKIKAARFDGHRWVNHITLSEHGARPTLAFNPKTNHIVALWADLTAGGTANTVKTAEFSRTAWTSPSDVSEGGFMVDYPQLHINGQGKAFAVWTRIAANGEKPMVEAAESLP